MCSDKNQNLCQFAGNSLGFPINQKTRPSGCMLRVYEIVAKQEGKKIELMKIDFVNRMFNRMEPLWFKRVTAEGVRVHED